jgi:DNA-directed RNA polymerase subunit RPC12/RpoP
MSTTPQAFYLRLNNHQGFMTGALAELYRNESMVDVTLTAEGQMIRAHKIVLSACSPYFKNIFLQFRNSTHYPVIIIKDMPFSDLKAIIEFIYRGEITIPREQLESLLTNGAVLQIKGLSEVNKKKTTDDNESIVDKDSEGVKRNACESSEIRENESRKRTRKRSAEIRSSINSNSASNGENCANYGDILSLDHSNDGLSNHKVDFHKNIKFIKEKFAKNETGNKKIIFKSESIANENQIESPMTADSENIVPFNLLEQSMMIDVKQDVNINRESSTSGIVPFILNINSSDLINEANNSEEDKNDCEKNEESKDNEHNGVDSIDDIPLALMTTNTSIGNEIELTAETCISTSQKSMPTKLRASNAGIPRKGTSIRSQKKYKCPVCHKIYVSPQNMKEHLRNTHTNPNEKYVCNICGKEYSWKHALDRHFKSKHI